MLAYRLKDALEIEGEPVTDYSTSWLPEIREDANMAHGVKQRLSLKIYSTSCAAVNAGRFPVDEVLSLLRRFEHDVFKRISLAIITAVGEAENAKTALAERGNLLSYRQNTKERRDFLSRFFPDFEEEDRKKIVAGLRAGITTKARAVVLLRGRVEEQDLQAAVERFRARQTYEQMKPIAPYLAGDDLARFDDLKMRFAQEYDQSPQHAETSLGPEAPKSAQELREMSTAEVLTYLESWTPEGGWLAPSPEGLGRALQPLVVERRREFLEQWRRVSESAADLCASRR